MARRFGEMPNADLEEQEEGGVARNCHACGKKQTRLVRIIQGTHPLDTPKRSRNFYGACTNKECWRHTDLSRVDNWVKESAVLPGEVSIDQFAPLKKMEKVAIPSWEKDPRAVVKLGSPAGH